MEGVTILTSEEVLTGNDPNFGVFIGFALIGFFIGILLAIKYSIHAADVLLFLTLPTLLGVLLGLFGGIIVGTQTKEIYYQATISDEVSLKDFTEKYEIIEQKGDLYTIKEKEE